MWPANTNRRPLASGGALALAVAATLFLSVSCANRAVTHSALAVVGANYIDVPTLNLPLLLPDPPANDSDVTRSEVAELLRIQDTRSAQQCEQAAADVSVSPSRFAAALGLPEDPGFDRLPANKRLFERMLALEGVVMAQLKSSYGRPRPFVFDARISPCINRPTSDAYPSGHSTWSKMLALVLADMVPERRSQLLQRADQYANNRIVGGVHYPSDVAAGKSAGTILVALLLASPSFRSDELAAKTELRAALALK